MPTEPVISVRGEAILEVEPEIAIAWVLVMARDADRQRAVKLLAERNGRVSGLIKGFGDAVEKVESRPVSIQPVFKDAKARERVYGYVARAGFNVTISDFAVLGEFVAGLASEDMVTVTGPEWRLRPDSPVYHTARLAAARDATQRAREYAEAFGGTVTGLVEAADTGMLGPGQPQRAFVARAGAMSHRAPVEDEPPEFDFEPAKQTVTAQIEARFTMTAPALGQ